MRLSSKIRTKARAAFSQWLLTDPGVLSPEGRKGSWARLTSIAGSHMEMKQLKGPLGTVLGAGICLD